MIQSYFRLNVVIITIMLFVISSGCSATYNLNQDILNSSQIKEKSFKKIFQDIKKTQPEDFKNCPIVVTEIKLIKMKRGAATEDWAVDICGKKKVYCVQVYWLKGSYLESVRPKKEMLAKEIEIWNAAKRDGNEDEWREHLPHIDEIEAMNQDKGN